MTNKLASLLSRAKDWGTRVFSAPASSATEVSLGVYRRDREDLVLIGRLSLDGDEYVFRYEEGYSGRPITAFPNLKREYRSNVLWPFFAIRIPPLEREDVRREMEKRSLHEDQVLELLASVARLSIANPYEFKLS